jgi:hypothetical protein
VSADLPAQEATRSPVWLTSDQRNRLAEAITEAVSNPQVGADAWRHLITVASELQVVDARDRLSPGKNALFRRASGFPADTLPVWIRTEEAAAVLDATDLPADDRRLLTQAAHP